MPLVRVMLRRSLAVLALAVWVLACGPDVGVGTPTPEPPDLLRRPEIQFARPASQPSDPAEAPLAIFAQPGSVVASSEVWITNLDDAALRPPVVVSATEDGAFAARVAASLGDRIRFIARLGARHSLPQDLTVVLEGSTRALAPTVGEELPCLSLTPREELTIFADADGNGRGAITLENRCAEPVFVEHASLRSSGPFKFELPMEVPPGRRAQLTVISASPDGRDSSDILLLDFGTSDARGRYAVGLWSIASVSRGNR